MKIALALLIILIIMNHVEAYGLASDYLENRTMTLAPGEKAHYKVEIQNSDSAEMKFTFDSDSDIVKILNAKEYYLVGGENKKQQIIMEVSVPYNATPGGIYYINYRSRPVIESGSQVGLNIELSNNIKVIVQGDPVKKKPIIQSFVYGVIALLMIIIVAVIVFRKNEILTRKLFKK